MQRIEFDVLVFSFDRQFTKDAIFKKIERLGLEVVDEEKQNLSTTTSLELPEELPNVEETLIKPSCLDCLDKPGLKKSDILRLRNIHFMLQGYNDLRLMSKLHLVVASWPNAKDCLIVIE